MSLKLRLYPWNSSGRKWKRPVHLFLWSMVKIVMIIDEAESGNAKMATVGGHFYPNPTMDKKHLSQ